jgi:hypothetical protein
MLIKILESVTLIFILLKSLPIDRFPMQQSGTSSIKSLKPLLKESLETEYFVNWLVEEISKYMRTIFPDFKSVDILSSVTTMIKPVVTKEFEGHDPKKTMVMVVESDMHFRVCFYVPKEFIDLYLINPLAIQANPVVFKQFILITNSFEEDPILSDTVYCFCR